MSPVCHSRRTSRLLREHTRLCLLRGTRLEAKGRGPGIRLCLMPGLLSKMCEGSGHFGDEAAADRFCWCDYIHTLHRSYLFS